MLCRLKRNKHKVRIISSVSSIFSAFLWTKIYEPGLDRCWTRSKNPEPACGGWSKRSMSISLDRSMISCPRNTLIDVMSHYFLQWFLPLENLPWTSYTKFTQSAKIEFPFATITKLQTKFLFKLIPVYLFPTKDYLRQSIYGYSPVYVNAVAMQRTQFLLVDDGVKMCFCIFYKI